MSRWLFSLLLSGLLLWWVFKGIDLHLVPETFASLHLPYLLAGFLLYLAGLLLRTLRYRTLLNQPIGLWPLLQVTQVRNMLADLLPARLGTISYVYLLVRRFGVDLGDALSSFFSVFFLDAAAIAPLLGVALLSLGRHGERGQAWGLVFAGVLLLAISAAALALLPLGLKVLEKLSAAAGGRRGERLRGGLADMGRQYGALRERGALWPAFGLSLGVRLAKYGSWYFLLLSVLAGRPDAPAALPFPRALLGVIGAELSSTLPLGGIAGFGTYEAAWSLGFGALGFSRELAAVSGLVTHLISQIIDYGLGIAALLLLYRPPAGGRRAWKTAVAAVLLAIPLAAYAAPRVWNRWFPPDPGAAAGEAETAAFRTAASMIGSRARLIWSSNRDGDHEIYSLELPGGRLTPLTDDSRVDFYSRFSPDGERILFLRSRREWVSFRDDDGWDIWQMKSDGTDPSRLVEEAYHPSWWPDGRSIVYHSGGRLMRLHREGRREETLADGRRPPFEGSFQTPYVSPDGATIALTIRGRWRGVGLWPVGSEVLSRADDDDGCQVCWGPDGGEIIWVSGGGRMKNRFLRRPARGGEPSLLLDLPGEYSHEYFPRVSNDGRFLVFAASAGGHEHDRADYEIFLWEFGRPAEAALRISHHSGNDQWPDLWVEP